MQIEYNEYVRVMAGESTKRQIVARRFRELNDELAASREVRQRENKEYAVQPTRLNQALSLCFRAAIGQPASPTEDPTVAGIPAVLAVRDLYQTVLRLTAENRKLRTKKRKK